jgi:ribose/xylose/arabinose/galactoside ABC-type transport system permease subunit
MTPLHEKIQFVGISLILVGILCLPLPLTNPKSMLSDFSLFTSLGYFWEFGLVAIGSGVIILVASFILKR